MSRLYWMTCLKMTKFRITKQQHLLKREMIFSSHSVTEFLPPISTKPELNTDTDWDMVKFKWKPLKNWLQTDLHFKGKPVNSKGIPELGQINKVTLESSVESRKRPISAEVNNLNFKNAPYIVWVYFDHEKQNEIVCIAIPIISGARDVDFVLSDDNITLNIAYVWPSALFSTEELFRKQLDPEDGGWTMDHPKIYSFRTRLHELSLNKSSVPPASISIKLPMKVQRESKAYSCSGLKTKDGNVVMLEFETFEKTHVVADCKPKIKFE